MATDFETLLKDLLGESRELFGESAEKLSRFQAEKMAKLTGKIQNLAREALKPEITRMTSEIADLRGRIAELEANRARSG
ncbi:MAG: hypothetical protein ABI718_06480 [Acidobacteriota bacterium]